MTLCVVVAYPGESFPLAADYEEQTTSILQEESSQSEGCVADDDDDDDVFIAFARVFSGTVRRGRTLFVLGPKHDPSVITDKVLPRYNNLLLLRLFLPSAVLIWSLILALQNAPSPSSPALSPTVCMSLLHTSFHPCYNNTGFISHGLTGS